MSVPAMIGHLLLEKLSRRILPRIPESAPVMDAADQAIAFQRGGSDEGILAHIYFFHAAMSLPLIRPGDRVLDLACGPANQLAHTARLNPAAHFIGVDAAPSMLALAHSTLASNRIDNAELNAGDITNLLDIEAASIDCALCTMSLHHLPDTATLKQTMREIRRVLKPGGGIYFADFGRLKRAATQNYFATDRLELQSPQFTDDFLNSMRAAFSLKELRAATAELDIPVQFYHTALAPFMIICRSEARRSIDDKLIANVKRYYGSLTAGQRRDFDNMTRWFRIGGLELPCAVH